MRLCCYKLAGFQRKHQGKPGSRFFVQMFRTRNRFPVGETVGVLGKPRRAETHIPKTWARAQFSGSAFNFFLLTSGVIAVELGYGFFGGMFMGGWAVIITSTGCLEKGSAFKIEQKCPKPQRETLNWKPPWGGWLPRVELCPDDRKACVAEPCPPFGSRSLFASHCLFA